MDIIFFFAYLLEHNSLLGFTGFFSYKEYTLYKKLNFRNTLVIGRFQEILKETRAFGIHEDMYGINWKNTHF